jgi:chaperonin GroEL (HSP60 family)
VKGDEKVGVDILAKALESPLRQIAENSGQDGSVVLEEVMEARSAAMGYDARTGERIGTGVGPFTPSGKQESIEKAYKDARERKRI